MATTTSYIEEMLHPLIEAFTPDSAEKFVNLQPPPQEQARVDDLAAKANEGRLTEEECEEYRTRLTLGDLISVVRVKARRYLDQRPA